MEEFFKDYQYTFSALSAIGAMLAVIISMIALSVSLWISSNQHRSRIVVGVGKRVIDAKQGVMISDILYNKDVKGVVEYVTVNISNVGLLSASIPYQFFWVKVPFSKKIGMVNTMDSKHHNQIGVPQKNYPVKIEPNHSEIFFVSDLESLKKELSAVGFIRRHFIKFYASTSDGKKFKTTISDALKRDIRDLVKPNTGGNK